MSQAQIYRSFRPSIINSSLTLSLVTTLGKVMENRGSVLWPPATSLALQVNLPSIFISKIMCVPKCLNPCFIFTSPIWSGVTPFKTSKATWALGNSFSIYFVQKVVPIFLSILYASSTVLGTWIPNLCVVLQYFALTFEIILYLFRITFFTHYLKAYSSSMFFATVYSVSSKVFEAFRSFNGIQLKVPSFHYSSNFQPMVVFLAGRFPPQLLMDPLFLFNAIPYAEWSLISFSTW